MKKKQSALLLLEPMLQDWTILNYLSFLPAFLASFILLLSTSTMQGKTIPVAGFLNKDGTLNMQAIDCQQLSLNLSGWQVSLDSKQGPIVVPENTTTTGNWSALRKGLDNDVIALAVSGTDIYVGGHFTQVGTDDIAVTGLNYIAKWDGTNWSALGSGLNSWVDVIAVDGTDLYAFGNFTDVGGNATSIAGLSRIAKWDGSNWSSIGGGLAVTSVLNLAIEIDGPNIYLGGQFTELLNQDGKVSYRNTDTRSVPGFNGIAKYDGTSWTAVDMGFDAVVYTLVVEGDDLYAGGNFRDHLHIGPDSPCQTGPCEGGGLFMVAKWDGSTWSPLGRGLDVDVGSLVWNEGILYAGGNFTQSGPGPDQIPLQHVAKWDGQSWSAVGGGLSGSVIRLVVHNTNLYASGRNFNTQAAYLAKWDGVNWTESPLGQGQMIIPLLPSGNSMYVGGDFSELEVDGTVYPALNNIAQLQLEDASNTSLQFDGKDDQITSGNIPFYQGSFTIEGWIKPDPDATVGAIFTIMPPNDQRNTAVYGELMRGNEHVEGKIRFFVRNRPSTAGGAWVIGNTNVLQDGNWHHIAAVKGDDDFLYLYVDGELDGKSRGMIRDFAATDYELSFGQNTPGARRPYKGKMDEFRCWDTARTQSEIKDHMNKIWTGTHPNLAVYYQFDQNSNSGSPGLTPVPDQSGNGHPGTLKFFDTNGAVIYDTDHPPVNR